MTISLDRDIGAIEARLDNLEKWMADIDRKVDRLLAAAAMGKGAWWATLKIGGALVLLAGTAAWVWERLGGKA